MNKRLLFYALMLLCANLCVAHVTDSAEWQRKQLDSLLQEQVRIDEKVRGLDKKTRDLKSQINFLSKENSELHVLVDSLGKECDSLHKQQLADKDSLTKELNETNGITTHNQSAIKSRTLFGVVFGVVFGFVLIFVVYYLLRLLIRMRNSDTSIDEVRRVQNRLQEDSLSLDSKLLTLLEQQLSAQKVSSATDIDHGLALKVADEIIRIETNLSRMDASVKGYKQLSKAVNRIKDNFNAYGYEIVDMLGKPYSEGMKVVADFVPDDDLAKGEQKITGIIKPQVNYEGKMIQAAQITVSQNL